MRAAHSNTANEKKLQSDDVSLAYEVRASFHSTPRPSFTKYARLCTQFAKKFPGYTAENLAESTQPYMNSALHTYVPLLC